MLSININLMQTLLMHILPLGEAIVWGAICVKIMLRYLIYI